MHRSLLAGTALGVVARAGHHLPLEWHWIAKVGVPWLVVAFAVGAAATGTSRAALDGALTLVTAIVVYYALPSLVLQRPHNSPLGLWWLLAAAPGGALFGALGVAWRSGRATVPIAALVSASLAAEALIFALWRVRDPLAGPFLIAAAAVSVAALVPDSPGRRRAVALTSVLTLAALAGEALVLRATGYVV